MLSSKVAGSKRGERRLHAVDAPAAADARQHLAEPAGSMGTALESKRLIAGATAMPPTPAANVPSSAARPNGMPCARRWRGPFHRTDSTARPRFATGARARNSPQLHESPVRRISPSAVAITTARRPPPSPSARTGTSSVHPPSSSSALQPTSTWRMPRTSTACGAASRPGPHRGVVPGDEERPRAEAPRRARRRATRAASRRGARGRRARARGRAGARAARCRRSRSTTPSAGRPWRCWPAASGPSGRAGPRSRPPRR